MSICNTVTIVASPRPRVGKTLIARLLIDFHRHEGRRAQGFDLNGGEDSLAQFMPEHVQPARIGDIKGRMQLFDRLIENDGVEKVIDLGHESFSTFFAVMHDIDFAREAMRRAVAPAVLFVMTPDRAAIEAFAALREGLPAGSLTPLDNEALGRNRERGAYARLGHAGPALHVPELAPGLRRQIDRPPVSFSNPADLPEPVAAWLRRIFLEFREFHLRLLLADLQSSLRMA